MTELHARIDVLEGELGAHLPGAGVGLARRAFAVMSLTRSDGTTGLGEASPLPGYSPDSIEEVGEELQRLIDTPLRADPLATPFELLRDVFEAHPVRHPSSRFALETALLDWLGRTRGKPLHEIVGGGGDRQPIAIADLVLESDPSAWPRDADALVRQGATHLKLKIGEDLERAITALAQIRRSHPTLPLRLDGNRRVPLDALSRHAASIESLDLELIEEPVSPDSWRHALSLPLPFALDESLRDPELSLRLLDTGKIRAVVLKPMVLGGFQASLELADRASVRGADSLVSHTFDGPIARAATAELALVLQSPLAAGLGWHPGLDLWPPQHTAAIRGRAIVPHDSPGLGLQFEEDPDA